MLGSVLNERLVKVRVSLFCHFASVNFSTAVSQCQLCMEAKLLPVVYTCSHFDVDLTDLSF